jgi:outer membrane protein TolC
MRYAALAFSAGLLFCSACLVGPKYGRPTITPPTAWKHTAQTEVPAENSVKLGVWPEADWWKRFKNEELTSYIETALRQNQDLRIAVARVEQARAQARQTRANEFPNVNLDPAATRTHNSENLTSFNLNRSTSASGGGFSPRVFTPGRSANIFNAPLDAGYEIDFWGRNRRATESARADLAATEQDRRTVFISLVSDVATAYFTLSELDELLDTTRRAVQLRKENLKLTQNRFQAGLVSELDVAQSKTQLIALRTHVEQTAADQRAADGAWRSLELARIRYKQGLSNYLPVLEAERSLLDAQNRVIQGKAARLTDIVSMYKALGGGW